MSSPATVAAWARSFTFPLESASLLMCAPSPFSWADITSQAWSFAFTLESSTYLFTPSPELSDLGLEEATLPTMAFIYFFSKRKVFPSNFSWKCGNIHVNLDAKGKIQNYLTKRVKGAQERKESSLATSVLLGCTPSPFPLSRRHNSSVLFHLSLELASLPKLAPSSLPLSYWLISSLLPLTPQILG